MPGEAEKCLILRVRPNFDDFTLSRALHLHSLHMKLMKHTKVSFINFISKGHFYNNLDY